MTDLQCQLDGFCRIYNEERPHQGISRATPISRWHASAPALPAANPLEHPIYSRAVVRQVHVQADGSVLAGTNLKIQIGAPYINAAATVILDDVYASVYINDQLVRHL